MRQLTNTGPQRRIRSGRECLGSGTDSGSIRIPLTESMLYGHIRNGNGAASRRAKRMFREASRTIVHLARPRALYGTFPVTTDAQAVVIEDVRFESSKIRNLLEHCTRACVFVVTLGRQVDTVIKKTQKADMAMAVTLDSTASAAAELAAQYFHSTFDTSLPSSSGLTYRYSPGYCDWPLAQQAKLFTLLPDAPLGVRLTDTCLMQPTKSVSGIIGIGPADIIRRIGNTCSQCTRHTCKHRRI